MNSAKNQDIQPKHHTEIAQQARDAGLHDIADRYDAYAALTSGVASSTQNAGEKSGPTAQKGFREVGDTYFSVVADWARLKANPNSTVEDIKAADVKAKIAFEDMYVSDTEVLRGTSQPGASANTHRVDSDSDEVVKEQFALETVDIKNWDEARRQGFEWVANLDRPIDGLSKKELAKARERYGPDNVLVGEAFDSTEAHRPVQEFGRAALYAKRPPYIDNHLSMKIDPALGPLTLSERQPDYRYPGS
ncbi:MAG: hypothetical protein WA843_01670 [Candidatus Saccharimonadales bacterium]